MELDLEPVRWDRTVWEEGDVEGSPIVFLFEFNRAGAVLRQIELVGSDEVPIKAASAAEWWDAQGGIQQAATPALLAYEATYGRVAEGSVGEWGSEYPGEPITAEDFGTSWRIARRHLESTRGRPGD